MAWIKMRHSLREDPAVILVSVRTNSDTDCVIGKLHRLWSWFDEHTRDGIAHGISAAWFDNLVGQSGFCDALVEAGWIQVDSQGVSITRFEEHNGESAKRRATDAKRKNLSRKCPQNVRNGSDKNRTREEKIREDKRRDKKNTCAMRDDLSASVDAIYAAYPKKADSKKAKAAIAKALEAVPFADLLEAVQAFAKSDKGMSGQFCPYAATWFNGERWNDDRSTWNDRKPGTPRIGAGQRYDPNATTEDDCVGRI